MRRSVPRLRGGVLSDGGTVDVIDMATNAKDKTVRRKKQKNWDTLNPPTAEPLPAKEIKDKDGKRVDQYPPEVGREEGEDERELSQEG